MEPTCRHKARDDPPIVNAALTAKGIVIEASKSLKKEKKLDENQLIKGEAVMYKTMPKIILKKSQSHTICSVMYGNAVWLLGLSWGIVSCIYYVGALQYNNPHLQVP